jgi:lysophospholipase L1-like esterase
MKARKIVIFIFSVLAALAVICAIFPADGITIGNIKFEFPSLHEALAVRSDTVTSDTTGGIPTDPEELFKYQLNSMNADDQKSFMEFCEKNPARFHMPENDLTYFDTLFVAMENAESEPMRILHYGDSQLEGDRISADFRERLQTAFGGGGVGLVPAVQSVGAMTVVQSASPQLQRYFAYNMGEHLKNGRYGVMAQVAQLNGSAQFTFRTSELEGVPHSKTFNKVTMACCGKGKASVNASGVRVEMTDSEDAIDGMRFLSATLSTPVNRVSVSANGNMEIFGFMLDSTTGISLDNIPMRGCSGTVFTITDRRTLEPFFKRNNVKLIILQYGGNSVPFMNKEKSINGYKKSLIAQVELFKKMAPDAKILFIGPADMATNVKGEKQTYPQLVPTIEIIKQVCTETGIAFWDLYEAMGGHNSMIKWVDANLAGKDYLHFTREGASKVADMLFNTYLMYYRFYCKRVGKKAKNFDNSADTIQHKQ